MGKKLFVKILPKVQQKLFDYLCDESWVQSFYLAGGTALALQIGHRKSVDFDFFTVGESFEVPKLINEIRQQGQFELFSQSNDTLHGAINGVQISFFKLTDKLVEDTLPYKNLRIASMLDIGTMKINAISGRGSKKDFIDLHFILKKYSFADLFSAYQIKYGQSVANNYHLLKSLTYFEDAERQPMPVMFCALSWDKVKKDIVAQVKRAGIL